MWITRISLLMVSVGALLAQGDIAGLGPTTSDGLRSVAHGQEVYEGKGNCASCHRIKGVGSRSGPDLSEIGSRRPEQLTTKLTNPDAEINTANRPYRVVLKNGTTVNGRLLNLDTFTVQMMDDKENLRSFVKSDLKEYAFVEKSPMPSYQGKLSTQEIADVVAYLGTLRPVGRGGAGGGGGRGAGAPAAAGPARGGAPPAEEPH